MPAVRAKSIGDAPQLTAGAFIGFRTPPPTKLYDNVSNITLISKGSVCRNGGMQKSDVAYLAAEALDSVGQGVCTQVRGSLISRPVDDLEFRALLLKEQGSSLAA